MRNRTYKIERWFLESAYRLENFFCFLLRSGVRPDHAAHFFHVQMFGKRRSRRHSEKCKEAIQIIGSRRNKLAIPFHDIRCFAQLIEHWSSMENVDWMKLERKRCDHAKIAAAAAQGPEKILILVGVRFYKFAVRQHDVGREQIVDAQSAF